MYILPTLPRGGGTAFPISLCLSRIVPANSKSSLKVIQVVKNVRNWFRLCKIVRPFYFLHVNHKFHAPETLTPRIFPHTEESILLWMQHLVHLVVFFLKMYIYGTKETSTSTYRVFFLLVCPKNEVPELLGSFDTLRFYVIF